MKLEKPHIEHIKLVFKEMQSREDLLKLLNYAKPLVYRGKTIPFSLNQLSYYANPKRSTKAYVSFEVKKKSGTSRTINAPEKGLKALQKALSLILQCVFEPHKAATGFVMGKSIVDNAKVHANSNYVFNTDLKDFFSSIDQARVWSCLKLKPFSLVDNELNSDELNLSKLNTGVRKFVTEKNEEIFYKFKKGMARIIVDKKGNYKKYRERITGQIPKGKNNSFKDIIKFEKQLDKVFFDDVKQYITTAENIEQLTRLVANRKYIANIIAAICCTEMKVERQNDDGLWYPVTRNVLPQGAPTSPVLSNVVCQRLDHILTAVADRFGLRYTRYADDITFSSMHNVYQKNGLFLKELTRVISDQGFHIKESKTRLQKQGHRQEVTGLLVNEGVNVQKRYIKQLRMWLYYWEKYGYKKASTFFEQQYMYEKGELKTRKPNMANVIGGKLDYLKMVKGADNQTYLKLKARFEKQVEKMSIVENILNTWENEGIEKAMQIFNTVDL